MPEFSDHMKAWKRVSDRLFDMGWGYAEQRCVGSKRIEVSEHHTWVSTGYIERAVKVFERKGANQHGIWAQEGDVRLFIRWV